MASADDAGIELCKLIKDSQATSPVLMLTSRMADDDKECGFDAGADDKAGQPAGVRGKGTRTFAALVDRKRRKACI